MPGGYDSARETVRYSSEEWQEAIEKALLFAKKSWQRTLLGLDYEDLVYTVIVKFLSGERKKPSSMTLSLWLMKTIESERNHLYERWRTTQRNSETVSLEGDKSLDAQIDEVKRVTEILTSLHDDVKGQAVAQQLLMGEDKRREISAKLGIPLNEYDAAVKRLKRKLSKSSRPA